MNMSVMLVPFMWKRMYLFLRKSHRLIRCWGWLVLLNRVGALTLSLLLKLPPRKLKLWFHSVHWGVTPLSKTPLSLFHLAPLKYANCPRSLFRQSPSPTIYCFVVFSWNPPKNWIFQWTPIILKLFILDPIPSLIVNKFLVKICQFKFLVMNEKHFCL